MARTAVFVRLVAPILLACGVVGGPLGAQKAQRASYYRLFVLPGGAQAARVSPGGAVAGFDGSAFAWRNTTGVVPLSPLAGWSQARAEDLNRAGLVVGSSFTGSTSLATVWDAAGVPMAIQVPGASSSGANAINRLGVVVGNSNLGPFGSAWVWDPLNGTRNLSTLGLDEDCTAADVNNRGQIVGGQPFGHAYRFELATQTKLDLGTLNGGSYSEAHGVNDLGHVVGRSMYQPGNFEYTPFFWSPGTGMQFLGTLAPPWQFLRQGGALAINEDDVVVGSMDVQPGHPHAFLWSRAYGMVDLNDLVRGLGPYELVEARDISNDGWIVVRAADTSAGNARVDCVLGPRRCP